MLDQRLMAQKANERLSTLRRDTQSQRAQEHVTSRAQSSAWAYRYWSGLKRQAPLSTP